MFIKYLRHYRTVSTRIFLPSMMAAIKTYFKRLVAIASVFFTLIVSFLVHTFITFTL